jgi:hypothetical protein
VCEPFGTSAVERLGGTILSHDDLTPADRTIARVSDVHCTELGPRVHQLLPIAVVDPFLSQLGAVSIDLTIFLLFVVLMMASLDEHKRVTLNGQTPVVTGCQLTGCCLLKLSR